MYKTKCNVCGNEGEWEDKINNSVLKLTHHPKCGGLNWNPIIIDGDMRREF